MSDAIRKVTSSEPAARLHGRTYDGDVATDEAGGGESRETRGPAACLAKLAQGVWHAQDSGIDARGAAGRRGHDAGEAGGGRQRMARRLHAGDLARVA